MSADYSQLRGTLSHLSQETLQSRREHCHDQGSCQEKPDPHAPNPLQEHVKFQLHHGSRGHHNIKLFKKALRHYCSELCELPGKHTVLCEFAVERKYELPGANADKRHDKENFGDEDQELISVLQLPHLGTSFRELEQQCHGMKQLNDSFLFR